MRLYISVYKIHKQENQLLTLAYYLQRPSEFLGCRFLVGCRSSWSGPGPTGRLTATVDFGGRLVSSEYSKTTFSPPAVNHSNLPINIDDWVSALSRLGTCARTFTAAAGCRRRNRTPA